MVIVGRPIIIPTVTTATPADGLESARPWNREDWLEVATVWLRSGILHQAGYDIDGAVRVSCGWPPRGGLSAKRRVIGVCHPPEQTPDGSHHIFISPKLRDGLEVLGVLVHELIHAAVGCKHKHDKTFELACRKLGLEGKPTATTVGEELAGKLGVVLGDLPEYPHPGLYPSEKTKAQVGRMLKVYCPNVDCLSREEPGDRTGEGFKFRLTRVWIDRYAVRVLDGGLEVVLAVNCPDCGESMRAELPEQLPEDDPDDPD